VNGHAAVHRQRALATAAAAAAAAAAATAIRVRYHGPISHGHVALVGMPGSSESAPSVRAGVIYVQQVADVDELFGGQAGRRVACVLVPVRPVPFAR